MHNVQLELASQLAVSKRKKELPDTYTQVQVIGQKEQCSDRQTDGQTDRRTDGRTGSSFYFIISFPSSSLPSDPVTSYLVAARRTFCLPDWVFCQTNVFLLSQLGTCLTYLLASQVHDAFGKRSRIRDRATRISAKTLSDSKKCTQQIIKTGFNFDLCTVQKYIPL